MFIGLFLSPSLLLLASGALRPPQRASLWPDLGRPSDSWLSDTLQLHRATDRHRQHNTDVPAGRPVEWLTATLLRYRKLPDSETVGNDETGNGANAIFLIDRVELKGPNQRIYSSLNFMWVELVLFPFFHS